MKLIEPSSLQQAYGGLGEKIRRFWRNQNSPQRQTRRDAEEEALVPQISSKRSNVVFLLMVLLIFAVAGKAFWLQGGISTEFLQKQGEMRYGRTIPVPAQRGQILDRNGVVLAASVPARSIWANPADFLTATPAQLNQLATILGQKSADLKKLVTDRRSRSFVYLARTVSMPVGEQVRSLQIPGVYVSNEMTRTYPEGEVSAHIVGFTDADNKGREGVELADNAVLTGRPGSRRVIRDRMGRIVDDVWVKESEPGTDVVLSIDSRLQYIAYDALRKNIDKFGAKAGACVVVDVRTGEILAMSSFPTYDPNERRLLRMENVRNRVLTDTYEPGSTMKPFAIAEALDLGIVTPNTLVQTAPGKLTIGNKTIGDTHDYGLLTVSQVVQKSSNIGTSKIALEIPAQTLWSTYTSLGFGQAPKTGFPGEATGRLRPYKSWRPIEQATMSYGHGIAVSLMQLVRAYTAIARNGDVVDLTFRRSDNPGTSKPVFKPEVAREVRAMMTQVVQAGGTARRVAVEGYTVAGKTGTANKLENGVYVDKFVASFIGITPAAQPRIIVAVMIDDPTKISHFGGTVAGPVFNEVAAAALRLYGVHPDAPEAGPTAANGTLVRGIVQ